jgi:hypothetical protein
MKFLLVFFATFVADAVWALYIQNVAARHAYAASVYASVLLIASTSATIACVGDHDLLWPAACGAFAGTWLAVRFGR